MLYRIRRVDLDNSGEIVNTAKRATSIVWPVPLKVGGLYFLRKKNLYRVEAEIS